MLQLFFNTEGTESREKKRELTWSGTRGIQAVGQFEFLAYRVTNCEIQTDPQPGISWYANGVGTG
jgi:hypothetical protein